KVVSKRQRGSYRREGLHRHDEREAGKLLDWGMEQIGWGVKEMVRARKNDPRKQALSWLVKTRTAVSDGWISVRLNMGHRTNISRAVRAFREADDRERKQLKRILL